MKEGIDWEFVERITKQTKSWPKSKREEWDRQRYPNGKKPDGK